MNASRYHYYLLLVVLFISIGCSRQNTSPPPKVIDPETGIFKFTGNVHDSTAVPDTSKGPWAYPYPVIYQIINRNVSSTIRITKVSDSVLILSRPIRDGLAYYSGVLFTTDPNDSSYLTPGYYGDTVITSKYLNNAITIPSQLAGFTSVGMNVQIYEGVGKFVNGQWELDYKTGGKIGSYMFAYHTYHLVCTK
jgi:hypothetical protein